MNFRSLLALSACLVAIGGCSIKDFVRPYRIDVRQGNFVTPEMAAQLRPGMSRDQVRFVLGTPLIVDPFHADRWDYFYRFEPGRGEALEQRLSVFFDGDRLARVEGGAQSGATPTQPASRVIEIGGPGEPSSQPK